MRIRETCCFTIDVVWRKRKGEPSASHVVRCRCKATGEGKSESWGSLTRWKRPCGEATGSFYQLSIFFPRNAATVCASLHSVSPAVLPSGDRNSTAPSTSPSHRIGAATAAR